MFKWIIIGGGIHGCTVATNLIKSGRASIDEIRIIDPHEEPLQRWKRNTGRTGMDYLRSTAVHHIDQAPFSLRKYAKELSGNKFYGYYKRPYLELFNDHCDATLNGIEIKRAWIKAKVSAVLKEADEWHIETEDGQVFSGANIVIAISQSDQLNAPEWFINKAKQIENRVFHIFAEDIPDFTTLKRPIVIIGGGITAGHTALQFSNLYPGEVTLLKRNDFRVHDFDSDPGWLGPKYLHRYSKIESFTERRAIIQQARNRGSIPQDLHIKLLKAERKGNLIIKNGEVDSIVVDADLLTYLLKNDTEKSTTASLILATGFQTKRPGQAWLERLIEAHHLQCAKCGFPILNKSLEWCPHLFVTGPLAELEIGPVSRNIAGARKAAEKIAAANI